MAQKKIMKDMENNAEKDRPLRVFIVEDSVRVRELLMDFLHIPGVVEVVGYADTERKSIEVMTHIPFDAAVVDLRLKEGSGLNVIEQVRKAHLDPDPKIIVFTNHPFPEIRKRALQLGADFFFDKSVDYDLVKSTLLSMRANPLP
jgi:two-component system, OmpR family, response regulator